MAGIDYPTLRAQNNVKDYLLEEIYKLVANTNSKEFIQN